MHLCKGNGLRPSHSGTCRLEMSANHVQFALHAAPYFMMRNRSTTDMRGQRRLVRKVP